MEKLKTLLLTVLVIASLLLSLGIWSITPQYESIDGPQFSSNIAITDPSFERTLNNVLSPRAVLLHSDQGKHKALFPGQSGYSAGMELLADASLFDIRIDTKFTDEEWKRTIGEKKSVQYDFDAVIPINMLNEMGTLHFTSRVEPLMNVRTIYLYANGESEFRVVFVEDAETVYSANVVLSKDRFQALYEEQKDAPAYALYGDSLKRHYFLPVARLKLHAYTIDVNQGIEMGRLVDSFFLDRSLTRRVVERDGSEIVTDGNRLVRVDSKGKMIEYRNLNVEKMRRNQLDEDMSIAKALDFANAHGGFLGQVTIHQMRTIRPNDLDVDGRQFDFRPTVAGLQVIGNLSSAAILVIDNDVAAFRRSPYMVGGKPVQGAEQEILSGEEVMSLVENNALLRPDRISDIYLAYLMESQSGQSSKLRPVWVIEQASDYREGVFDAVTGVQLQSEEVMLRGLE